MEMNTQTLLIIFVGLTGVAVLLQACVLVAIFISLRKTSQSLLEVTNDLKEIVIPMIHSTREILDRISPQVITATDALAEISEILRKETNGVRHSASEIMERVSRQTARLDSMLTTSLNKVERAGIVLEAAVALPVRQANGIFAAFKAAVETYMSDSPRRKPISPDRDALPKS